MRKFLPNIFLTLVAAAAASAQVPAPLGKGLESLDMPFADSFLISGRIEESYASENMTGASAIFAFGMMFPKGSYELDTTRQVVIALPAGYLVTTDSAGLPRRSRQELAVMGANTVTISEREYDALGRVVVEASTSTSSSNSAIVTDRLESDTIHWTWSHPGCADDQKSDTSRVWSVDAQGRCATADVRVVSGVGSVSTGLTDKILWQGDALAGALRLQGTDTLFRDVFAVDGRGNVTEHVSYEKQGGQWSQIERDTFAYLNGKLDLVKLNEGAEGEYSSHIQYKSTRSRTSVSPILRSGDRWIAVARDGNEVAFTNRSTESVVVDLLDAQGRRLHTLLVGVRSTATWSAGPNGPVFWRARTLSHEASGRLPSMR